MNEQEFHELLDARLSDELEGKRLEAFDDALANDENSRRELQAHQTILDALADIEPAPIAPASLRPKIMAEVRALAAAQSAIESRPSLAARLIGATRALFLQWQMQSLATACFMASALHVVTPRLALTPEIVLSSAPTEYHWPAPPKTPPSESVEKYGRVDRSEHKWYFYDGLTPGGETSAPAGIHANGQTFFLKPNENKPVDLALYDVNGRTGISDQYGDADFDGKIATNYISQSINGNFDAFTKDDLHGVHYGADDNSLTLGDISTNIEDAPAHQASAFVSHAALEDDTLGRITDPKPSSLHLKKNDALGIDLNGNPISGNTRGGVDKDAIAKRQMDESLPTGVSAARPDNLDTRGMGIKARRFGEDFGASRETTSADAETHPSPSIAKKDAQEFSLTPRAPLSAPPKKTEASPPATPKPTPPTETTNGTLKTTRQLDLQPRKNESIFKSPRASATEKKELTEEKEFGSGLSGLRKSEDAKTRTSGLADITQKTSEIQEQSSDRGEKSSSGSGGSFRADGAGRGLSDKSGAIEQPRPSAGREASPKRNTRSAITLAPTLGREAEPARANSTSREVKAESPGGAPRADRFRPPPTTAPTPSKTAVPQLARGRVSPPTGAKPTPSSEKIHIYLTGEKIDEKIKNIEKHFKKLNVTMAEEKTASRAPTSTRVFNCAVQGGNSAWVASQLRLLKIDPRLSGGPSRKVDHAILPPSRDASSAPNATYRFALHIHAIKG